MVRPSHQILTVAISELVGSRASLVATFRRPGRRGWSRTYTVSAAACHFVVRPHHAPSARPTTAHAAIALMSRDGRLALESVDLVAPARPPFHWFGPAAGIVDSAEPAHAAAQTIQRAFFRTQRRRRLSVQQFLRAYATAATETLGAGRLLRLPSSCMTL